MARPAACVVCRQNKPYGRLEQLTQELNKLKSGLQEPSSESDAWPTHAGLAPSTTSGVVDVSPGVEVIVESPQIGHDSVFRFDDLVLSQSDVAEVFHEYFVQYHKHLPVLDEAIDPAATLRTSPLLFWTIVFTACRNLPSQQHHYPILCNKLPSLLASLMTRRRDSVYNMQALIVLSMWPPPVQRISDDMRWMYSGMAMQMALQAGCHRVGYEHEYHAFSYSKTPADERTNTRIWRCWCFVNALLSCELGLPCLVPFDALDLQPSEEAALPADFVAKLRIVLYVSRINDMLGDNSSKDGRNRMKMVRLVEKDVNLLASGFRQSPAQWNPTVEFVYLGVLLNVYAFCLRWTSGAGPSDPDNAIIQSSAAQAACQLIDLYASSPLLIDGTSPTSRPSPQRYFPKFYHRFHTIALLTLLKISALNKISLRELGEANDAIRVGHAALMACSSSEGDEYHRAASVVEVLCKKDIIESIQGESPVESRLGASLWLELVATAVRWRRQNAKQRPRPKDDANEQNSIDGGDNTTTNGNDTANADLGATPRCPFSAVARTPWPGDATMAAIPATANGADTARLAMADLQNNVNLYPFTIEDWSGYMDFTQTDLGLGL